MWIVSASCDYCGTFCTRDHKDDNKEIPMLYTPGLVGVKQIVCENCYAKIQKGLGLFYENLVFGDKK